MAHYVNQSLLSNWNNGLDPKNVNSDGEVMVMLEKINNRYNTISAALSIIDPEGVFVPGTKEHNWVTESILSWMAEMEHDDVLRKSESAKRELRLMALTIP